jgi:hypothetical protein
LRLWAAPWYIQPDEAAIRLGQQLPEVNAVVTFVIALTIIPVVIAARIAGAGAISRSARNVPAGAGGS